MNQGLGPVVGNRFDDERKTALKPHLMERLVANTVRAVPMGTMVTEDDGRMAFVPNYTHSTERAAPKAQPAEGDDEPVCTASFDPMKSPLQVGDRVKQVLDSYSNFSCFALVERIEGNVMMLKWESNPIGDDGKWLVGSHRKCFEIVSRGETKPAAPAFDPMTEPLQLGDYVKVVFQGLADSGKQGQIIKLADDDGCTNVCLRYDDGTEEERGWANRSSLKLIRKATPA